MSRWKAAAIHLLISALVVTSIAAAITWIWYPPATWHMAEIGPLMAIVAAVDVVIGPLLTLIVFKSGKPSLRFDLSVIALLQIVGLSYAVFTVWQSRPVYIVGVGDIGRFNMVFANEVDPAQLPRTQADGPATLPRFGPEIVGAQLPINEALRQQLLWDGLAGNDIQFQPHYFVPYAKVQKAMAASSRTLSPADAADNSSHRCMIPYVSSRGSASMQIDCESGAIIGPSADQPAQ